MNEQIAAVFTTFLYILMGLLIARALMSWFSPSPTNPLVRFLYQVTEPLLEPIRRILPRTGMIDLSTLVLIILLQIMVVVVNEAATSG